MFLEKHKTDASRDVSSTCSYFKKCSKTIETKTKVLAIEDMVMAQEEGYMEWQCICQCIRYQFMSYWLVCKQDCNNFNLKIYRNSIIRLKSRIDNSPSNFFLSTTAWLCVFGTLPKEKKTLHIRQSVHKDDQLTVSGGNSDSIRDIGSF